jgi:hypothetical protein
MMRYEHTAGQPDSLVTEASQHRRHRRIGAFPSSSRPAVDRLARIAPAIEDLADSFPALLFALATGYGSDTARRSALAAVTHGLPLREAASRLALPFWLRKLPASALAAPLVSPPSDPQLVNRLISLIPATPAAAAAWLERVMIAHHSGQSIGRPELALWVAQQHRGPQPSPRSTAFLTTLAWCWYSAARGDAAGLRGRALLAGTHWTPSMGARRASVETRLWRERIALDVCLGPGLMDSWLAEGTVGDLAFVPLRSADDFIAEARSMDNCLDRYADRLVGRAVRVFSIRRDGRPIADVEITAHDREPGHPSIAQLRAAHNRRAPLEIWQAAHVWLGSQPLRLADRQLEIRTSPRVRKRREQAIWQPFLDALPPHAREALEASLWGKASAGKRRPTARRSVSGES